MKSTIRLLLSAVCIALIGFSSCQKDEITTKEEIDFPGSTEIITTSLAGNVIDEAGLPLSSVQVKLKVTNGNNDDIITTLTDQYGDYLFREVKIKGNHAVLTLNEAGYFDIIKRIPVAKTLTSFAQVKLVQRALSGVVDAGSGGEVQLSTGAKLNLAAGTIVDDNGNTYTGNVNVYMRWMDPTREDLNEIMIGDLSGVDNQNKLVALETFGMIQVDLESNSGSALNLKDGETAQLSFPIPSSILSDAPSDIPLWIMNESNGYWEEIGMAISQDGNYIAEVPHFSSFNVDGKGPSVEVKGKIVIESPESVTLPYGKVYVHVNGRKIGGRLCDDGTFLFLRFPMDEDFILSVEFCGQEVFRKNFGRQPTNIDLGEISLSPTVFQMYSVAGNAIDCDAMPLNSGAVFISENPHISIWSVPAGFVTDGDFDVEIASCDNALLYVRFLDLDHPDSLWSDRYDLSGQIDYQLKDVEVCDGTVEPVAFNFEFDAEGMHFEVSGITAMDTAGMFYIWGQGLWGELLHDDNADGMSTLNFAYDVGGVTWYSEATNSPDAPKVQFEYYGENKQDRLKATFSGNLSKSRSGPFDIPATGEFDFILE